MVKQNLLNADKRLRIETARISNFIKHSKLWMMVLLLCVGLTPPMTFWLYYSTAKEELHQEFFTYVESIPIIAASQIDPHVHAIMVNDTHDTGIEYLEVLNKLAAIHRNLKDIRYLTSMVIIDNEAYIVTDSSTLIKEDADGNPLIPSAYMEKYNTEDEEDYLSYAAISQGKSYVYTEPYTDEFGSFVGACAPIEHVSGAYPTMICVDIAASDFYEMLAEIRKQFIYTSTITAFLCFFIFYSAMQYQRRVSMSFGLLEKQRDLFLLNAHSDPLTGAMNRRSFELLFKGAINQVRRREAGYCLIALDIDHFKSINDNYGHDNGDIVLVETVKLLKSSIRAHDHIARMGGEEFMILSSINDDEAGQHTAEKIRQLIENLSVIGSNGEEIRFTTSIGVHNISRWNTLETAMKSADKALYFAKQNGRNQVCISSQIEDEAISQSQV